MIELRDGVRVLNGRDPRSFEEYWPFFLSCHLHPLTRAVHAAGNTVLALASVALLGVRGSWRRTSLVVGAGLVGGGVLPVASHYLFENNRPSDDIVRDPRYPLWLAGSAIRLTVRAYIARLDSDVQAVREALGLRPEHKTLAAAGLTPKSARAAA